MKIEKLLVLPRVFLGVIFLYSVGIKLFTPLSVTVQIESFVGKYGVTHAYPWYRGFLQDVVMHHVGLFGALIVIGEVYVGLALLFGITTRLAAAIAIFLLLNFMATKGAMPWNGSVSDPPDIVLGLVVMIGAAGRTWGVDRYLHERYPRIPFW